MSYNVAKYIVGWLFKACKMVEKMADLCQNVFAWSTNAAFTRQTHTLHTRAHAHTYTHANTLHRMR